MDKYGERKGLKSGLPIIYTNGPQDSLHFVLNMSELGRIREATPQVPRNIQVLRLQDKESLSNRNGFFASE